jgi:hypothetical protein
MTAATLIPDHAQTRRPLRLPRDPLGLIAGFRGYLAYRDLSALSDADLAARGLTRADIPTKALAAITRDL